MTAKYLYTTIAHERKSIKKIPTYLLKILTCSIILLPSNNLVLGQYELSILKRTFPLTTGFCHFREGERRCLSIGDNFLQQLRRPGVSPVCKEQGRIQDFRFSGVEGTKWHAKCAAILAMPIFAAEKRSFPPFSHHTLNTVLEGSTERVTVSTCIK